jgi:heat shock protein HslJ
MKFNGGQEVVQVFVEPITTQFSDMGTLAGYGGCNNYDAHYNLTGDVDEFGNGITITPIELPKRYCEQISAQELQYLQILQNVTGYEIDSDMILSMNDPNGNTLVFSEG